MHFLFIYSWLPHGLFIRSAALPLSESISLNLNPAIFSCVVFMVALNFSNFWRVSILSITSRITSMNGFETECTLTPYPLQLETKIVPQNALQILSVASSYECSRS